MVLLQWFLGSGGEDVPPLISAILEFAGYPVIWQNPPSSNYVLWSLHDIWG